MPLVSSFLNFANDGLDILQGILPYSIKEHATLLSLCCSTLVIWRLCRFHVARIIYPDDPLEIPYWIPIVGHLFSFFGDSNTLLTKATRCSGKSRDPYALTVAGMKTYVITNAEHAGQVYRNTESFSYEEFVRSMMHILGNSEVSVKAMFTPLPKDKEGFPNPHGKPLGLLFRQMHIKQLFPGPNLSHLENRFYEFFDQNLELSMLGKVCPYAQSRTSDRIVLPLTKWCSDFFCKSGQAAYFGPRLAEIDTGLTNAFITFDDLSYQVIYQYPRLLSRSMLAARDRVINGLRQYLQLPHDQRSEDVWFVKAMESEMRAIGLSAEDMAIATMTIYWAINTNSRKAAFWMLAHLLETPALMDVVRQETASAFRENGTVDLEHLHSAVPNFDAMWNEMLRMSAFSASVRYITADTAVGNKILRKGNRLIIPYRQLHMDPSVFGDGVDRFKHDRFLKNPRLAQGSSFRPFGGGTTMCPGHFIAKRAVYLFTAIILHRFEVKVVGERQSLEPDLTRPVPGLMSQKDGQELFVELSRRRKD
ncbi:hypothetical protein HIM_05144 [Hirsutella minnesotensis 3608]|uniref:Cytochrome P450 n=1 Tax=Hirsutella minnesotensis 3608 TaxID=1043627 RepID=A0A0F7ZUU0_9HYPO|nr:hypothetical protein HIM_05144 [Hirsutella minnesotensis 3608]